ncbi:glycosyltransferase family 2 protein [Olsenella intestinalis]|uniref:glycosyltransferase family 2 protein n=1 Tax=Olsenella intestinalis TaxID=2930083 RepID=UPI00200D8215|nr:glycosyltransferase family 2 protein [Olsenella intestinalis]
MSANPTIDISIVVPAYNVSKYLDEFFSCVNAQTYQGFRLVMVDDCATDDTFVRAKKAGSALGDRFVLLQNKKNLGLSGTRNTGLDWVEEHPTEYVTFLDPDDWFEPTYLEDLHDAAKTFDADLSVSGIVRFEDGTEHVLATEMVNYSDELFDDSALCDDLAFINPCAYAKLYRFDGIKGVRFRQIKRSEDTCYLFESLPNLKSVKFTNNALYHYRVRRNSLTAEMDDAKYESMHQEFAKLLPKFSSGAHAPYREMFECQVFIRSSVGGVTRLAFSNMGRALSLARGELHWLDSAMPSWRKNKYLSFGKRRSRGKKQFALKASATLYKLNIFVLFIFVYYLVSNVLKKEVRA